MRIQVDGRRRAGRHYLPIMKDGAVPTPGLQPQEWLELIVLSVAAIVLGSLDQCTRGPSITAMVLTNLHHFI